MLASVLLVTCTWIPLVQGLRIDSLQEWEEDTCIPGTADENDELSINCTGLDYHVHYGTGFEDSSVQAVYLVLFCGPDCAGNAVFSSSGSDDFDGLINSSCIMNQTNCTIMGCYEVSVPLRTASYYQFASATCQIDVDSELATMKLESTGTEATTTELGTTAGTVDSTDVAITTPVTSEVTSSAEAPIGMVTTFATTTTVPAVVSMVIIFVLFLIIVCTTLIIFFRVRGWKVNGLRKCNSEFYYLKSWSLFNDKFDDQFQPPVGLELSKTLSESQPSIYCALYQHPCVQENLIKESGQIEYLTESKQQSSELKSSNHHVPSTAIELDLQECHNDRGYCNDEETAIKRETAQPFMQETNNNQEIRDCVKNSVPNNSVSVDEDELHTYNSEAYSIDSLIGCCVDLDDSVTSGYQGYTEHNCNSVEVDIATPRCVDTEAARKSSINSVADSVLVSEEEPPTSPVVVFDFGVSPPNFDGSQEEAYTPAAITPSTLEETTSENAIVFDFGTSDLELNGDSNKGSDTASLHEELEFSSFSWGQTLPHSNDIIEQCPTTLEHGVETVNGYVVDVNNEAHHSKENINPLEGSGGGSGFDRNFGEYSYTHEHSVGEVSPLSLGEFSLNYTPQSFLNTKNRSGYVTSEKCM